MLRELKTFIAVVQAGTFAAAGARVGLSQSAVSAQMQRLEEALGAELFSRTGRSASLNGTGREAVALAQDILDMFDRMSERLTGSALRGQLRIGAIQSVLQQLLPDALRDLHDDHPQVGVKVVHGSSLTLVGQIDSGELDAALMVEAPFELPADLAWSPLLREPYVLMLPEHTAPDFTSWQAALQGQPFIRYDRTSFGGRRVERFLRAHGLHPRAAIDVEDVDAMARMVARGLGVALLPQTRADVAFEGVVVKDLGADTFHRDVGLLTRREPERNSLVSVLRTALLNQAVTLPTAHPVLQEMANPPGLPTS